MPRPMTIMHAIEKNRLTTGSVVQMMEAACGLASRGHAVTVAAPSAGDLEDASSAAGLRHLPLALTGSLDVRSAAALRRHLRSHPTDVLHVHKGRAHSVALMAATGLGRLPVVVVNRGVTFPLDRFNRHKYRHPRVGAVVCVAGAVRRVVISSGRLDPAAVRVVHGGTDPGRFNPTVVNGSEVRTELGLPGDTALVGTVSARDWKGWLDLMSAFASIPESLGPCNLLLVGCEPAASRQEMEAEARRLGVARRVLTLPYRRDMPEVLAACDVVVDASWAGTGITGTIREAMCLGRPVVATDCGGNSELVVDGECGLLVPPRDRPAMAEALVRLLGDPDLRTSLGTAARQRVLDGFTTEQRIDKLEALYLELIGGVG